MGLSRDIRRKRLNVYNEEDHTGKRCGLDALDRIVRFDKKALACLVARTAAGKTTFIDFYAYKMATAHKWKTAFFSFETPQEVHDSNLLRSVRKF